MTSLPSTVTGRPVRTATRDRSIWRHLSERAFRRNVVKLARRCNEVGWKEVVVAGISSSPAIVERSVMPRQTRSDDASYQVPLEVERRLTTDIAFIAANEAGAPKVTAACVEENYAENEIRLWLAANAGIEGCVEEALLQIWDTAVASAADMELNNSTGDAHDGYQRGSRQRRLAEGLIFDQIVRLNRVRIRSRIRNALGYAPEHLGAHVSVSRHAGGLQKDIKYVQKHATGHQSQGFLASLKKIHTEMTSINQSYSKSANVGAGESMVERLKGLTKMCFSLTNKRENGQMASFPDILQATGLNADKCAKLLNEKSVAEVEKIGSYRRISKSLLQDCLELCHQGERPPRLRIERAPPYQPTISEVSLKSKCVDCHVHAEIQLLCKWLMLSRTNRRLPRVIGASKLSCFLCFLCVSCCGGPSPPRPHGRIYDQWTIPDVSGFDDQCIDTLRRTIALMNQRVVELSKLTYSPRLWPMTSRVDLSGLLLASLASMESLSARPEEPSSDQVLADAAERESEPGLESPSSVTTVISLATGKAPATSANDSIRSSASPSGSGGSSQATSIGSREEVMPTVEHDSNGTSEKTHDVTGKAPARSSDDSNRSSASSSGSVGPSQATPVGTTRENAMPSIEHDSDNTLEETRIVTLPKFVRTFYIDGTPRIKLLLEVEAPCNGEAQLSALAPNDANDSQKIDLSRLIRGEEITVVRKEGDSEVCVDLCSGSRAEEHRLTLTWIS